MSTDDMCANCGKGEGCELKTSCDECKIVKYCSQDCQLAHLEHRKECKKQHTTSTIHPQCKKDVKEALFKQPPKENCPICTLPLPSLITGSTYSACCGKIICSGCDNANGQREGCDPNNRKPCPFCRTPDHTSEKELIERYKERMEANDATAIYILGCYFSNGLCGFPHDNDKALELIVRAGELGKAEAFCTMGYAYYSGNGGVERDRTKAKQYIELAAMSGDVNARCNLGIREENRGDMNMALNHYMIGVRSGHSGSLSKIKGLHSKGHVSKDEYAQALGAYKEYIDQIKSEQRDKAATYSDNYRYY